MHAVNPLLKHALVLAVGLALMALGAGPGAAAGLDVSHFTLGNGLEVVVIPDHRTPVVTHMVWYKVGSADETAGESGLAHFLEHLMFKGTKKNPLGRYSQTVSTLGGQENAFTSSDYTAYYQRVPRERLKTLMEFESDRMTGLALTDEVVKPELQVVLEEQNMRVANNPGARLGEQMEAALRDAASVFEGRMGKPTGPLSGLCLAMAIVLEAIQQQFPRFPSPPRQPNNPSIH